MGEGKGQACRPWTWKPNEISRNLRRLGSRDWKWCGAQPEFCGDEVEGKTEPEGGAEDRVGVQSGETAGGDRNGHEYADDGADGGYGEANGEGADHPLAVEGDFAVADVPEGFAKREEKERAKERGGGGLCDAADGGHGQAHDEGGATDDGRADQKDPAGDAVPLRVVGAKGGAELEGTQDHEENAGEDVDKREIRMAREDIVNPSESRGCRIGG